MRDVHEIRIHGVNNTPPAAMLGVGDADVSRVTGTDKEPTGFWHVTGDRYDWPTASREAYSWGGVNSAPGAKGPSWAAVRRALWLLLLPGALANVGYWARPRLGPRSTTGAFLFRLAALLMTSLGVVVATGLTVDQVAWQCFRDGTPRCPPLPSWLEFLADETWDEPARRLAVGSVGPLLLLVVLWAVSRGSLQRYEEFPDETPGRPDGHLLESKDFWNGRARTVRLQRLHLATGLFLVTLLTALPFWDDAEDIRDVVRGVLALAVAGLALVVLVSWAHRADGGDHQREVPWKSGPGFLLAAASILTAVHLVVLLFRPHQISQSRDLPGVGGAPLAIVAGLCLVVLAVFLLRWSAALAIVVPLLLACATAVTYVLWHDRPGDLRRGYVIAAVAVLLLGWVAHGLSRTEGDAPWQGFGGAAPAVLLGLGVFVAVLYATSVTLLVADRLNGGSTVTEIVTEYADVGHTDTTSCEPGAVSPQRIEVTCTTAAEPKPGHVVPVLYFWLASAILVTFVSWLLLGGCVMLAYCRSEQARGIAARVAVDYPAPGPVADDQRDRVTAARRRAGLSRRAERVAGILALPVAATVLVAVGAAAPKPVRQPFDTGFLRWVSQAALITTVTAAAGLLLLGLMAYRRPTLRRTIGVVWDLGSFWPRAVHPFAPPCYAERGVPELSIRSRWRLGTNGRLLFSAHSLGCLLAVATFFRLGDAERRRVLLLTYGCQLRLYFSRMFPAVLGPAVLGVAPVRRTTLTGLSPPDAAAPPPVRSLASELGAPGEQTRWLNLYRESDPLGFRAFDDLGRLDLRVMETSFRAGDPQPADVATHSGYPATAEYADAVATLLDGRCTGPGGNVAVPAVHAMRARSKVRRWWWEHVGSRTCCCSRSTRRRPP